MYNLTLDELNRFDFPIAGIDLMMLNIKDWKDYFASKTTHKKLRACLFSSITKRYKIEKIIDDYPSYFTVYRQFKVSERVGYSAQNVFHQKIISLKEQQKWLHGNNYC